MKKYFYLILPIFVCFACEDVISVDLDEGESKLVIEATALQYENTEQSQLLVKLSETIPFYSNEMAPVSNAEVKVTINHETLTLIETFEGSGEYREIIPMIKNQDYELSVISNNEEYRGVTQLQTTVPFDYVEQAKGKSFDPDLISIEAYFTDPAEEENYYYLNFIQKETEES
ncbi:DUF4249 family protein [Mesonia maritima]|uniref:DUF4249 family protein n=1 Tax=Mesonia maritima TaxID=1793873 RepID=UPI00363F6098